MKTNHTKTGVEPTPETSSVSNITHTMENDQHNIHAYSRK